MRRNIREGMLDESYAIVHTWDSFLSMYTFFIWLPFGSFLLPALFFPSFWKEFLGSILHARFRVGVEQ